MENDLVIIISDGQDVSTSKVMSYIGTIGSQFRIARFNKGLKLSSLQLGLGGDLALNGVLFSDAHSCWMRRGNLPLIPNLPEYLKREQLMY